MRWRAVLVDGLVAISAFAVGALILANADPVPGDVRRPDVLAYLLLAAYNASVVVRRRAPVAAVVAGLLSGFLYAAANYPLALTPVVVLPIYTAAVVLPHRRARWLLAGAVVIGLLTTTLGPGATDPALPALMVSSWLLGNYVGSRRAYTAELEHKNRQLEHARRELTDQAVADERLRIARELHDVVAHSLSVVALHAGTARMVADDNPVAARAALATIETASRSALAEMRRLLGVLRGADDDQRNDLAPAPGLADLDALVAEVVRSGVTVRVCIEGERPDVPAGVDLSAYRIVQEALTNVIKHAGRARTTITIRYADDAVTVEVDDEGRNAESSSPASAQPGHGLVGMRERVAIYGGDLEAGACPAGGFRVAARLPFAELT
jgi:signal transduction histidine kinase